MIIENSIGWCDETTNAVTGCEKVDECCKNCYAQTGTRARVLRGQGIETWGANGMRYPVMEFAKKIRRLNKLCICDKCHTAWPWDHMESGCGRPDPVTGWCEGELRRIRLFADSNSDWLDLKWKIETFADFLKEIFLAPNVDVLLLSKRLENFKDRTGSVPPRWATHGGGSPELVDWIYGWRKGVPPNNIWIGGSVGTQKTAHLRIPQLLAIPAKVHFLSVEPLLEEIEFSDVTNRADFSSQLGKRAMRGIKWAIVGGESGAGRRDCGVYAIESVARQCVAAGIPVFVKQDCALKPGQQGRISDAIWKLKQFPKI